MKPWELNHERECKTAKTSLINYKWREIVDVIWQFSFCMALFLCLELQNKWKFANEAAGTGKAIEGYLNHCMKLWANDHINIETWILI